MKDRLKKIVPLLVIIFLGLWAAWPLITKGFIPTHDGEYHIIRFYEFDKSIKAGIFFPRWAPGLNSGFGVPLFSFFYPLPNYLSEFFHFLGFSFVDSLKFVLAFGLIVSGIFFYLWAKEIWGAWGGLTGSIFYILAPYHLVDIYVRGSPGEVLAIAFYPAVLWAVEKKSNLAPVFLALLILSHNILALIFLPFLISYFFFRRSLFGYFLKTIFLGLGLSAYFWLPALAEARYVVGLKMIDFADHFLSVPQLIFPSWGTGFSVPGIGDQLSFQIGLPHLLVVFLVLVAFFKERNYRWLLGHFLFWFLAAVFLLLPISIFVWDRLFLLSSFQYPWRFLSLIILVGSFLAGYPAQKRKFLALILIFLAIAFYSNYSRPVKYLSREDSVYLGNPYWTQGTATLNNSFNTVWFKSESKDDIKDIKFVQNNCRVNEMFNNPIKHHYEIDCEDKEQVQLGLAYFPGWQVLVDDQSTPISFSDGLIDFKVNEGKHFVKAEFQESIIRKLADSISLVSLLFLLLIAIFKRQDRSI